MKFVKFKFIQQKCFCSDKNILLCNIQESFRKINSNKSCIICWMRQLVRKFINFSLTFYLTVCMFLGFQNMICVGKLVKKYWKNDFLELHQYFVPTSWAQVLGPLLDGSRGSIVFRNITWWSLITTHHSYLTFSFLLDTL